MTLDPAGWTERGDRRARGDGVLWFLLGLALALLGWIAGWSFAVLLGGFVAIPALLVLLLLRRDRVRRGVTVPKSSRE
ncbi:hypothetical protein [Demetria terragena]|uniref:hypothetical protein n=1 Tax=Demetria terragena TaxID=63959 RepID=UPI0012EA5993|nr:hypothetical protein [Demetria terragena]